MEEQNVAMFPDAPTLRGIKHINDLIISIDEDYEAYIFFIIQMKGVSYFTPNNVMHKDFGDALAAAKKKGVNILALDSIVTKDSIKADEFIEVKV